MNAAAMAVVTDLPEIVIAYGVSDEFRYLMFSLNIFLSSTDLPSFAFHKSCNLFERRARYVETPRLMYSILT